MASAVRLFAFLIFAAPAIGCTQTIHPPKDPVGPTRVYVADYGLHSGIFLPQRTEGGGYAEDGPYVEYAFGDWSFMALGRTGPLDALSAVFVSQQSALGSRVVRIEGGRMPPNTAAIPERINGFYASRADVERLALALERRHRGRLHTGIRNLDDETVYVKDLEHYWLGHQCNHVTLRWLAKLGCDVRGLLPTSHFRLGSFRQ